MTVEVCPHQQAHASKAADGSHAGVSQAGRQWSLGVAGPRPVHEWGGCQALLHNGNTSSSMFA